MSRICRHWWQGGWTRYGDTDGTPSVLINPRLTGVSAERHWPGGGAYNAPPQANSQTNDRSETGEAVLERSRRYGSKALLKFFLKVHVSGTISSKVKIERFRILVLRTSNLSQTGSNSAETLSKVKRIYCMSLNAILSMGQGQGQVTKGHYIQKSHCGHMIHVLWPIWSYNSMVTLVWSSEVLFRSFQRNSGRGQVKKGQIFIFINVDKKGVFLDQFWLRNLMMSFVFAYDPQKLQISHLKKTTPYMGIISETKILHWGSKIELSTWNCVCW